MSLLEIIIFIALWLIPLTLGAIISGILSYTKILKKHWSAGGTMQIVILSVVLIFGKLYDMKILGLKISILYIFISLLLFPVAMVLLYLSAKISNRYKFENTLLPHSTLIFFIVFIFLAPISEELLYRGLLEGYMLLYTNPWEAILIPAILFSIMHLAPFKHAPKILILTLLLNAFILGIAGGYIRYISDSIVPAIIIHAEFNLAGWIFQKS